MQMLQHWYQAADKQSRQDLALPDDDITQNMLELGADRVGRAKQTAQSAGVQAAVIDELGNDYGSVIDEEFDADTAAQYADEEVEEEGRRFDADVADVRGGRGFGSRVDRFRPGGAERVDRYTPDK